eukprot:c1129_g1_i1.p1 GENE.c1129_g1_i1~~c1129_g1_i1.p1  ORF type:complete len:268 (-),score=31.31 c1129_g1_i1:120-923(-)
MTVTVVVTGASRGFGRAVSIAFCEALSLEQIRLILIGRNHEGLLETARSVRRSNPKIICLPLICDLFTHDGIEDCCTQLKKVVHPFSRMIVVHNAGTLGPQLPSHVSPDLRQLTQEFILNVTSVISLNALLLQEVHSQCPAPQAPHVFINVSSLAALKPFPHWTSYCATKAARNMVFRVVALEQKPEVVKVLNYGPGPMLTELVERMLNSSETSPETREVYRKMIDQGSMIVPIDSARRLVSVALQSCGWVSGDHVDVYDLPTRSSL